MQMNVSQVRRKHWSKDFSSVLFKHVGLVTFLLHLFSPLHFLGFSNSSWSVPFCTKFTLCLAFIYGLSIYHCHKDGISPFSRPQDIWKLAVIFSHWGNRRCFWKSSSTPALLFQYNIFSAVCRLQTRLGKYVCWEKAKPQYQMRKQAWQYILQDWFWWSGVAYDFIVIISTSHNPVR